MAVVVLVHGIAQEQESADSLEAEWLPALAGGLRTAGYDELADRIWRTQGGPGAIEARMAFYGDCFLRPGAQGTASGELTPDAQELAEQLARAWLERAAAEPSTPRDQHTAQVELGDLNDTLGQAQSPRTVVRSAMASLARLRWFAPYGMAFAQRFVDRALVQVTRYFTDNQVRQYAQEQVAKLIGPDTRVLVGHSLGSVVTYEAAQRMKQSLPLLVTLGSPLGLRTIVYERLQPQPPGFPTQAGRWVNVAARDDFVAAAPDLSLLFESGRPQTSVFEGGWTVDNGAQPHTATFYLTKRAVSQPIAEVLVSL
jgi:hypothetical protein